MKRQKRTKSTDSPPPPARRILVLHGPNLNLLGLIQPDQAGAPTLANIHQAMEARGRADGVMVESFQSNHEGQLIDRVQAAASEGVDFIILNPSAYSTTSIALSDALAAVAIPFIEVDLDNPASGRSPRAPSRFTHHATGVISGLGAYGYMAALEYALSIMRES